MKISLLPMLILIISHLFAFIQHYYIPTLNNWKANCYGRTKWVIVKTSTSKILNIYIHLLLEYYNISVGFLATFNHNYHHITTLLPCFSPHYHIITTFFTTLPHYYHIYYHITTLLPQLLPDCCRLRRHLAPTRSSQRQIHPWLLPLTTIWRFPSQALHPHLWNF